MNVPSRNSCEFHCERDNIRFPLNSHNKRIQIRRVSIIGAKEGAAKEVNVIHIHKYVAYTFMRRNFNCAKSSRQGAHAYESLGSIPLADRESLSYFFASQLDRSAQSTKGETKELAMTLRQMLFPLERYRTSVC